MTSPDHVMALLEEANPIPDIEVLDRRRPSEADITASRGPHPDLPSSSRRPYWVIAAAVAALLMALFFLFGGRATVDPVDTGPEPTPIATPEQTESSQAPDSLEGVWQAISYDLVFDTTRYAVTGAGDLAVDAGTYSFEGNELILSSDASSASCPVGSQAMFAVGFSDGSLELDPIDDECGFGRGLGVGAKSLDPGEARALPESVLDAARPLSQLSGPGLYTTERFSPPFSVVLPPGWFFHAGRVAPEVDYTTSINNNQTLIVWYRHNVGTPDDVYELFSTTAGVEAAEPGPTSIAGSEGITFDYFSPGTNNLLTAPGIGAGTIVGPPENVWRTWAIDVDGVVVTIVASFEPATLSEMSVEVEQILESITWTG